MVSTREAQFARMWSRLHPQLTLTPEYRFTVERRWRFDFAHPASQVAIEVEGGVWNNGRHTRGKGFIQDCVKYNTATLQGWAVFRLPPELITPATLMDIASLIEDRLPTPTVTVEAIALGWDPSGEATAPD